MPLTNIPNMITKNGLLVTLCDDILLDNPKHAVISYQDADGEVCYDIIDRNRLIPYKKSAAVDISDTF